MLDICKFACNFESLQYPLNKTTKQQFTICPLRVHVTFYDTPGSMDLLFWAKLAAGTWQSGHWMSIPICKACASLERNTTFVPWHTMRHFYLEWFHICIYTITYIYMQLNIIYIYNYIYSYVCSYLCTHTCFYLDPYQNRNPCFTVRSPFPMTTILVASHGFATKLCWVVVRLTSADSFGSLSGSRWVKDTSTADGLRQAGQKGESLERWGVDSYGGFLSHAGTPKSSIVRSFLVLKAMVTWGSTILRNPPYIYVTGVGHSQALG